MITFGKVFCTKSKPNCNACPMRAECRHFASAFASARLALPGPEEKGMVSASLPVSANGNPAAAFKQVPLLPGRSEGVSVVGLPGAVEAGMIPAFLSKPMPQPPQITSVNREVEELITSNCEPIIEEPASPEPLPEVSTSDIEDAFYEDPDEIPTIELNMKEFTTNLQAILQGQNLGMQDGDLSKALITLKPDAASIPTPKLKNISHLRTEHQV
nr:transcriptional activator DEMETER-like [Ipomoea batatas]